VHQKHHTLARSESNFWLVSALDFWSAWPSTKHYKKIWTQNKHILR